MASSISTVATQEEFRELLDELRRSQHLSYTQIGTRAGKGMGRSTAHAVISSDRLPRREHLLLFLRACKVPTTEQAVWLEAWKRLDKTPAAPTTVPVVAEQAAPAEPAAVPYQRLPTVTLVRSLVALAVTTFVISGSAVAMWVLRVPVEVIIAVYALVTICVAAWVAVTRAWLGAALNHRGAPPPRGKGNWRQGITFHDVLMHDPPTRATAPVIGDSSDVS
jgi:hypothetical protein